MRDITNEQNNIYEVQRYLRRLHHDSQYDIPLVNIDGIYGDETADAVEIFQRTMGLPVTGNVDLDTWNALFAAYTAAHARNVSPLPIFPFPEEDGYVISDGEYSDIAALVQFLLRAISDTHDDIDGASPEGIYGEATMKDIREFQRIYRLPITGNVDKATWNELARAYNRSLKIKN